MASGLALDPNSVTGHLLAAYLHVAQRTIEPAKREFRWVLGRDPVPSARAPRPGPHRAGRGRPRRVSRMSVERAARLSGFPGGARRARRARRPADAAPRRPRRRPAWSGCGCPAPRARSCVVDAQGRALVERPAVEDAGPRLARVAGLAGAALQRAGFGPLRRAILDDREQTDFIRADGVLTLALALPRTTPIPQGLLEVNRLWGAVQHELAVTRDERPVPPPDSIRRVS